MFGQKFTNTNEMLQWGIFYCTDFGPLKSDQLNTAPIFYKTNFAPWYLAPHLPCVQNFDRPRRQSIHRLESLRSFAGRQPVIRPCHTRHNAMARQGRARRRNGTHATRVSSNDTWHDRAAAMPCRKTASGREHWRHIIHYYKKNFCEPLKKRPRRRARFPTASVNASD
jgi:hypothetical protein